MEFNAIYEDVIEYENSTSITTHINSMPSSQEVIQFESTQPPHQSSPPSQEDIIDEPYYQVPKSCEPYYEIPKPPKPVPLYENVDMYFTTGNRLVSIPKEPPKEKPPPPPTDYELDDESQLQNMTENFRRKNSTHRIKNELRLSRTSFLGLTDSVTNNYLEVQIPPPPDMANILREERKIEKQMYQKSGIYDSSETNDSRDSGVSENHSRQSSELFTSSEELEDCHRPTQMIDEEIRMKCIEEQIREQEVNIITILLPELYLQKILIISNNIVRKFYALNGNFFNLSKRN